ncbi:MAG: hypothetical protein WAO98_07590 [Alphaproteobacteria bacterium]
MFRILHFLYDSRAKAGADIATIVGERNYGEILFKRKRLHLLLKDIVANLNIPAELHYIKSDDDLMRAIETAKSENQPLYYHPAHIIPDPNSFTKLMKKSLAKEASVMHWSEEPVGYLTWNPDHLKTALLDKKYDQFIKVKAPDTFLDIAQYQNCLRFISSGFEARFFNNVKMGANNVIKQSENVPKIKAEHDFYHLLPAEFKKWFVEPFAFRVQGTAASYSMKRLMVPDVALQWIHGALTVQKFNDLLNKIMVFITSRPTKTVDEVLYCQRRDALYLTKLLERIEQIKKFPVYEKLNNLIRQGTRYESLQQLVDTYVALYKAYVLRDSQERRVVIGHGDLCFSNMLYDTTANALRLVDPKGATTEDELWTDALYDFAKLSHSILGDYDWINNDLFSIQITEGNQLNLKIETDGFNVEPFKEIFIERLRTAGVDMYGIRLYEASLFLSMLPLHITQEQKLLAFILRAASILEELQLKD